MNHFDVEGEIQALRKEFAEREVQIAEHSKRINNLEFESRNHRDRDVKILGILHELSKALETNARTTATMKKQINKLFVLTKKELDRERRTTPSPVTKT